MWQKVSEGSISNLSTLRVQVNEPGELKLIMHFDSDVDESTIQNAAQSIPGAVSSEVDGHIASITFNAPIGLEWPSFKMPFFLKLLPPFSIYYILFKPGEYLKTVLPVAIIGGVILVGVIWLLFKGAKRAAPYAAKVPPVGPWGAGISTAGRVLGG